MITIRVNDSYFTCMLVEQQHQREIWASPSFYWKIMNYYFLSGVEEIEYGGTVRYNNCLWKGFNKNPSAEWNQWCGNSELPWSILTLNISEAAAFHSHSLNMGCHVSPSMTSAVRIFLQLSDGFMTLSYWRVTALHNDLWPYDKLPVELKHVEQTAELISPQQSSLTSSPLSSQTLHTNCYRQLHCGSH